MILTPGAVGDLEVNLKILEYGIRNKKSGKIEFEINGPFSVDKNPAQIAKIKWHQENVYSILHLDFMWHASVNRYFYFSNEGELRTNCDNLLPDIPLSLRRIKLDSINQWSYETRIDSLIHKSYTFPSSIDESIGVLSGNKKIYNFTWGPLQYNCNFELQSIENDTLTLYVENAQSLRDNSDRALEIFFAEAVFNLTEHDGINYIKFQFDFEGKQKSIVPSRKDFEDEFNIEEY